MQDQVQLYQKSNELSISKIRGVTSYGMLCSEAELKLSDESEGITELSEKYKEKIGKKYYVKGAVTQLGILGCDVSAWNNKFIEKIHFLS